MMITMTGMGPIVPFPMNANPGSSETIDFPATDHERVAPRVTYIVPSVATTVLMPITDTMNR